MALEQISDEGWPEEGRTLGEIIERLVGPELWAYLLDLVGDRRLPSRRFVLGRSDFRIAHYLQFPRSTENRHRQAVDACLPFLDAWNSGAIVARARVGGPFEPQTDIPPPRAGYTMTVRSLLRSVIIETMLFNIDPTTHLPDGPTEKRFCDVRFFLPLKQTTAVPHIDTEQKKLSLKEKKLSLKEWVVEEIKRTPPPLRKDRVHGWKTEYAKQLAMKASRDPLLKETPEWKSIRNYLRDL